MRTPALAAPAILALLGVAACHSTKPAPEDLDGLAHWYWQHFDGVSPVDQTEGTDADAIAAQVNLDAALAIALGSIEAGKTSSGSVTDLSDTEQAIVVVDPPRDVALAAGIYIADVVGCSLDQIERITIDLDQDELYPGSYDSYERTYTSDVDAYLARDTPYLTWESNIDATVLGASYHEDVVGGARYVFDDGSVEGGRGDIFISRVTLTAPAEYEEGSGKSFDQDYQLDIYYPLSDSEVVHFYPLWRQYDYGTGLDQDSSAAQGVMMGGLFDYDDDNAALCADGF